MAAAVVLTVVAPFISLIAALVLRSEEKNAERRRQLSSWAAFSGGWLAIGGIILIAAIGSIGGGIGSAGCKGGIDHMIPPTYTSSDGQHWTAEYVCMNGGTTSKPAHEAWLNQ